MQAKYEQQLKATNAKLEETSERMLDLQSQLEEVEQKNNFEKQQWLDNQESMKSNMTISQSQYNDMNKAMDELKSKSRDELERLQFELQDLQESSDQRQEELEQSLKEKEDEVKGLKNMFEKEMAIYKQKVEFKEVQTQQLKSQLEETRSTHESMVKAMENKSKESHDGKEVAQKQVEDLKNMHS